MADLKTRYLGLEIKNPIVVGASNLSTNTVDIKRLEEAGAAAIVYKSLFEEQIQLENLELFERKTEYEERNAEMVTLFPNSGSDHSSPEEHLVNLKRAKESVSIPLIASLNAVNEETWVDYALKIEKTGVDAIELNFYTGPEKYDMEAEEIEKRQVKTLIAVRSAVKIPVSVKLSPYYTNPLKLIYDLDKNGADGFVLFNRLFQPDIEIETEQHQFPYNLSHPEDKRLPLRFAGLLYGNTGASICANSGIFSGKDVIKMVLAGADCVQVVSTIYLNKPEVISSMVRDIEKWMDSRGYKTLDNFRGKLSVKNSKNKHPYHRAQYIDFMMSTSEILKKYKVIH
ncbi:MAG: dihydroorotate dehydrogenase-like protein [Bacteroidales bacterium]|jgi:dihydroorotate dehydrogenase (fumarate)|nr:dihydroorotate dehydrogenase-like protein [Bacteroidales bacterium]